MARESIDIAAESGDPILEAYSGEQLCSILSRKGDFESAVYWAERGVTLRKENNGPAYGVTASLNRLANMNVKAARYEQALEIYREGLAVARANADRHNTAYITANLADAYGKMGRRDDAVVTMTEAMALLEENGDTGAVAACHGMLSEAHERAGYIGDALAELKRAIEIYDDLGHPAAAEMRDRLAALEDPQD